MAEKNLDHGQFTHCELDPFDEGHLQRMDEVFYETDVTKLSATPDVSNYLVTEGKATTNKNVSLPISNGTTNSEVEKKWNLQ
ncbi:hypothetical protein KI387_021986, partial [Taxus chinensis]